MKHPLVGIVAYPVTPFRHDGGIDTLRLELLIERLLAGGAHAIAPLGSAGEGICLSHDEWELAARTAVAAVAGRAPAVAGISCLSTEGALRRARFAEHIGAQALMLTPVAYWPLSEAAIVAHYAAIGNAVALPIMLYNNPSLSHVDMPPELMACICREVPRVAMVKDSTGNLERMRRFRELTNHEIPFFIANNPLAFAALAQGADGWCTASANLVPAQARALYDQVKAGRMEDARATHERLLPLLRFIHEHGLPVAVKAGLRLQGLDTGEPRLPLLPLDRDALAILRAILALHTPAPDRPSTPPATWKNR